MIKKILLANRGEIACRVIQTAAKLGIKTVAIYSAADSHALHVEQADEAYYVGPAPSNESYLQMAKIIEIAQQAQVDAIHPGYGFLSENTTFAELCETHNIIFIGPPSSAITAMASKSEAKRIMQQANVPLIPGYHGEQQDIETLRQASIEIGFPVLLKAALGGGGKGMRVVHNSEEFDAALAGAKREALASFGDDSILIEKYLSTSRHVEVQIFADQHGNVVHLFERDCSIQRRHQKVIEEAPAFAMTNELRAQMTTAACQAAKAINYVGAGTIEFLLDTDQQFYFMEMNTRLQVEHPVTEKITGLDLVEWQIRVASGQPLPLAQDDITCRGHAFETRIYAEDPDNDFLPSIGNIHYLRQPATSSYVRIDTGIREGDTISMYYDPMIAKLIAYGENRNIALRHLRVALEQFNVLGVKSNLAFLRRLSNIADFADTKISTRFIEQHASALMQSETRCSQQALLLATLFVLLEQQQTQVSTSPWLAANAWQANLPHTVNINLIAEQQFDVSVNCHNGNYTIALPDYDYADTATIKLDDKQAAQEVTLSGDYDPKQQLITAYSAAQIIKAQAIAYQNTITIIHAGKKTIFTRLDPGSRYATDDTQTGHLLSPMPGKVIALHATIDQDVKRGDALIVIEAMKMEHTIYAPISGTIQEIPYTIGELVAEGDELIIFAEGAISE